MSNPLSADLNRVLERTRDLWDELRGQRIFITGATGFFGCWTMETFLWANQRLALNARATALTRNPAAFKAAAAHLACDPAVMLLAGDVRTFDFPAGEFSHVIHAATESAGKLATEQPRVMYETIVEGTRRCLLFSDEAGTRKFLFTSSGAVYGKQPPEVSHVAEASLETATASLKPTPGLSGPPSGKSGPTNREIDALENYAEAKRVAEALCVQSGVQAKIARCFAFVGPYMKLNAHFAIGNFIRDQLDGGPIVVRGDGTPFRSYMYAADLMVWLWTILFRGAPARPYNVGSEEAISIGDLAHTVADALTPRVEVQILGTPTPGAPAERYVPSTARAREELGLSCEVSLREAIQRTQAWQIKNQKS